MQESTLNPKTHFCSQFYLHHVLDFGEVFALMELSTHGNGICLQHNGHRRKSWHGFVFILVQLFNGKCLSRMKIITGSKEKGFHEPKKVVSFRHAVALQIMMQNHTVLGYNRSFDFKCWCFLCYTI